MTSTSNEYQQLLDSAPVAVCWLSRAGKMVYSNQAMRFLLGVNSEEELSRWSPVHGILPTDQYSLPQLIKAALKGPEQHSNAILKTPGGERVNVVLTVSAMDAAGATEVLVSMNFARRQAPKKDPDYLYAQLQFMVESATDAFLILNNRRDIVYANRATEEITGYSKEELMRMNVSQLDPDYPATSPEKYSEYAAQRQRPVFETEHVRKNGKRIPVEVTLVFEHFRNELLICAYVRDITERKRHARVNEALQFALEHSMDAIYLYDREGNIYFANQSASRALGYKLSELKRMNIRHLDCDFSELDHAMVWERRNLRQANTKTTEYRRKDGTRFPVEVVVSAAELDRREFAVAFVRDISDRLEAQEALAEGEERFRLITDTSPVALITAELRSGRIQYANKQVEKLFGKPRELLMRTNLQTLFKLAGLSEDLLREILSGVDVLNQEVELRHVGEHPTWVSISTSKVEMKGQPICCFAMMDITEARELSNQLSYQATYDDLTGLVNRREFEDRLQEVIEIAAELKNDNVLCYLDLDQFKIINDTCGHMAGDELLRQIAQVLYSCVRQDDTLARLGGDEFAILLENCNMDNAEKVAIKMRTQIQEYRFSWGENTFAVSASMGLVPIGTEGESISEVLKRADTACYAAKDAGRNRIHISRFDDQELVQRHGEMQWISRISDALDQDSMELWRQRITPAAHREPHHEHFELLVRMRGRDGSLIMPGAFLPAAERYDLATRIDRWVVKELFAWYDRHPDQLESLTCCAINLSGQTLGDADFLSSLIQLFQHSAIHPSQVCFEITETAAIANLSSATHFMKTLKELGCSFSLDDFGSGLSSFAYLKNLPVDYVKIDGFFVKDVMTDPVDLAMVKAINDMAHALGKLTIAEFVEDQDILDCLIELGVDFAQGYGIAKPEPLSVAVISDV